MDREEKLKMVEVVNQLKEYCSKVQLCSNCPCYLNEECELVQYYPQAWDIERMRKDVDRKEN